VAARALNVIVAAVASITRIELIRSFKTGSLGMNNYCTICGFVHFDQLQWVKAQYFYDFVYIRPKW